MRLGVFGGTFDPPHVAHLAVAEAAREQAALDRVLWVPTATSPFKRDGSAAAAAHRLEMVRLATADHPAFAVEDLEVRRGGVSYTVDTLRALAERHPEADLALVLGGDAYASLPGWREADTIQTLARLVVYGRPGDALPPEPPPGVLFVEGPRLDLSSTELRRLLAAGRSARYLVPEPVRAYIAERGLYRDAPGD